MFNNSTAFLFKTIREKSFKDRTILASVPHYTFWSGHIKYLTFNTAETVE